MVDHLTILDVDTVLSALQVDGHFLHRFWFLRHSAKQENNVFLMTGLFDEFFVNDGNILRNWNLYVVVG